jgi:hypothetical protein
MAGAPFGNRSALRIASIAKPRSRRSPPQLGSIDPLATGSSRADRSPTGSGRLDPIGGEHGALVIDEPQGAIERVGDGKVVVVHHPVVERAQREKVVERRRAAVGPVHDVMGVDEAGVSPPGEPATPVP